MHKKWITISLIGIFSLVLWGSVSLSGDYYTTLKIPVKYENIPDEYSVGSASTNNVTLSIRGMGWQLAALMGRDLNYTVSADFDSGKQSVYLKDELNQNNWISSNYEVIEINPNNIEFDVEKVASKKVKVISDLELNYRPNYDIISKIKLMPDSIEISGPGSVVESTEFVETENKSFNNLEKNFSERIPLAKDNRLNYSENEVRVQFDIQKIADKSFERIPIDIRGVPSSRELILFPPNVTVVLRGGIKKLASLNENDIYAFVTFRQALDDSTGALEPVIEIPDYTTLINIKPIKIEYIIKQL